MAMERLSQVLRQQGNDRDKAIADIIDKLTELRGGDISMGEFSGKHVIGTREIKKLTPIIDSIRDKIVSGQYRVGSRLDPKILARQYQTNTTEIGLALNNLRDEGLVERKQKRGTIVLKRDANEG